MTATQYVSAGATTSIGGKYRYHLWREWRGTPDAQWKWLHPKGAMRDTSVGAVLDGAGKPLGEPKSCTFIMLNPSTADGENDDPTIRRCVRFAKSWCYDRLDVINLFAYRATKPAELLALDHYADPVGHENEAHADMVIRDAGLIVCAWGAHGGHLDQDETMMGWIGGRETFALGLTAEGHPRHPLYVPASQPLIAFRGRA